MTSYPPGDAPYVATATVTPVPYGGKPAYRAGLTNYQFPSRQKLIYFFVVHMYYFLSQSFLEDILLIIENNTQSNFGLQMPCHN
ncbi:hypothetical protein [Nostoc parmelioides]|uniref:Uncharacterized protein n=1 Tax=Nostoc parmelioides FACHB-3921 TaxID=2692909 RepID=A0ABR8BRS3_9NOSO|nr:hypothetical protein [Nostoc parmelioides]MBD2255536.1 hypothetical protein [Nostoc parmelioides FACHB-3921]